jgi:hypothetical protein
MIENLRADEPFTRKEYQINITRCPLTESNVREPVASTMFARTIENEVLDSRWEIDDVLGILLGDVWMGRDMDTGIHNCRMQQVRIRSEVGSKRE